MPDLKKKIAFISRKAETISQEALDTLLIACTFDQEVSAIFLEAGVLQLNSCKLIAAFPLYGIHNVYVEKEAFDKNNLVTELPIKIMTHQEINSILQQQHTIFNL